MTPNRLIGVRAKIERANKHVCDLKDVLRAFRCSYPYRMCSERDAKTGEQIHRVSSMEPIPVVIPLIVGDAIHCLRSSLDHLACQLVQVGTGNTSTSVYFPIVQNSTEYEKAIQGKVTGAREDAKEAIRLVQAYKGGKGHQLWVLNRLDNTDKHRLLLTVVARYATINFEAFMPPGLQHFAVLGEDQSGNLNSMPIGQMMGRSFDVSEKLCPLKVGDVLLRGIPNAEMNNNVKPIAEVTLVEPETEPGSILEFLTHLSQFVEGTVNGFVPLL